MIRFRQNSNYEEFNLVLEGNIRSMVFDPNKWLLADVDSFNTVTSKSSYTVNPNPVYDKARIIFRNNPGEFTVYLIDMAGKIVRILKGEDRYTEIDLSGLESGKYILLLEVDELLAPKSILKM
ncbi:MAG: T9SS type A sorting domain-containing protein [Bacteroidales bacterium]|nr:T9SS type A sorting domain-containing protein [Bacteroidales bacterium]